MVLINVRLIPQSGKDKFSATAVSGKIVMGQGAKRNNQITFKNVFSNMNPCAAAGFAKRGEKAFIIAVMMNKAVFLITITIGIQAGLIALSCMGAIGNEKLDLPVFNAVLMENIQYPGQIGFIPAKPCFISHYNGDGRVV